MGMGGVHREIVPPERIVCTQLFDEDWTGGEAVGTLVLVEQDGKTTLTNTDSLQLTRGSRRCSQDSHGAWRCGGLRQACRAAGVSGNLSSNSRRTT